MVKDSNCHFLNSPFAHCCCVYCKLVRMSFTKNDWALPTAPLVFFEKLGEPIVMGQVVMATDHGSRWTKWTSVAWLAGDRWDHQRRMERGCGGAIQCLGRSPWSTMRVGEHRRVEQVLCLATVICIVLKYYDLYHCATLYYKWQTQQFRWFVIDEWTYHGLQRNAKYFEGIGIQEQCYFAIKGGYYLIVEYFD